MGKCYWKDGEMFCVLEVPSETSSSKLTNAFVSGSSTFSRESGSDNSLRSLVVC